MHDLLFDFGERIAPEKRAAMAAEFPPQHHPIVRTYPKSGERVLFVNASFTSTDWQTSCRPAGGIRVIDRATTRPPGRRCGV